jgi:hypothetical protein
MELEVHLLNRLDEAKLAEWLPLIVVMAVCASSHKTIITDHAVPSPRGSRKGESLSFLLPLALTLTVPCAVQQPSPSHAITTDHAGPSPCIPCSVQQPSSSSPLPPTLDHARCTLTPMVRMCGRRTCSSSRSSKALAVWPFALSPRPTRTRTTSSHSNSSLTRTLILDVT